jgi:hypothetical protein
VIYKTRTGSLQLNFNNVERISVTDSSATATIRFLDGGVEGFSMEQTEIERLQNDFSLFSDKRGINGGNDEH